MRLLFVFEIDLLLLVCVLAVCVLEVDDLSSARLDNDEFIMIEVCGYLCTIAGLSPVGAGLERDTVIIMVDLVLK
jgi:hypothetical protein